jgi:flagellar assembly protein FliH
MRKSNVLENAFVSSVHFGQLAKREPKNSRQLIEEKSRDAERATLEAEWTAKMNKAFERGLAQGEAHAAETLKPLLRAFEKARGELAGLRAGIEAEAEREIVDLAVKLAETVVQTQVGFDRKALRSALGQALRRAPEGRVLRIRVNPGDLEAARSVGVEPAAEGVEILGDAGVGRGGCVVETELGQIYSTIESRWEAAQRLLLNEAPVENGDAE